MKDTYTKKRLKRLRELQNQIRNMSLTGLDDYVDKIDVPDDLIKIVWGLK